MMHVGKVGEFWMLWDDLNRVWCASLEPAEVERALRNWRRLGPGPLERDGVLVNPLIVERNNRRRS